MVIPLFSNNHILKWQSKCFKYSLEVTLNSRITIPPAMGFQNEVGEVVRARECLNFLYLQFYGFVS